MTDERHKAVLRVQQMRALAEGTHSEEEASLAREMARKLMDKHGLTEDDVTQTRSPLGVPPVEGLPPLLARPSARGTTSSSE